jgi:prepilin-type N-terminal cleavage/methylation domain-containing protein
MLARIRKATEDKEQGFTLIELLVVIIIIGILASIAIPVFLNQRKKGVDASLKSDLKSAATAMETYFTEYQAYNAASALAAGAFKASPGNTVTATVNATTGDTYCIAGTNPKSTKGAAAFYYDSDGGGLLASSATTCTA